ncbi:MAG: PDZ domain-containing protein [Longimicrobiaceae bacterium]
MRTCILALGSALALSGTALGPSGAASQGAGDPRIPLRPGGVGLKLEHRAIGEVRIVGVLPGSPAEAAGLGREDCVLLAVDGRPVGYGGVRHALTALTGPLGTPVEVTVRRGRAVHTVRMVRGDMLAPGYTEVVLTRHFVVHHRPVPAEARKARWLARDAERRYVAFGPARDAERRYAASGLPRDTRGWRAHLWVADRTPDFMGHSLPAWAGYALPEQLAFGYVAYGDPGRVGEEDFAASWAPGPGREQVREAHMATARTFERVAAVRRTGKMQVVAPMGYRGPWRAYGWRWGNNEEMSLRHYTLDRFGIARFRRLWASDLTFNDAVRRELGVSAEELLRGWEAYVRTLGPDPEAPLSAGAVAGTFAWVGLALLFGARMARTKELD